MTLDELADRAFAKARKAVHKLPDEPADEELHRVRKKGKRARYAAELAGRKELVRQAKSCRTSSASTRTRWSPPSGCASSPPERRPSRRSPPAGSSSASGAPRRRAGDLAEGVEEAPQDDLTVVRAAGGLVVRDGKVLLVHRPKYDDWSFPKGKCDERRVRRGVRAARGRGGDGSPLRAPRGDRRDELHRRQGPAEDRPLLAHAAVAGEFAPHAEVDEIRWETPDGRGRLLSWSRDLPLLERL